MPDPKPRLLFDENLSRRLVAQLRRLFPGSRHVTSEGLESASDAQIWAHAARHRLVIVTKDADFHQRSFVLGAPPKVVWLRVGNCSTDEIARLLRLRRTAIRAFAADKIAAFLELNRARRRPKGRGAKRRRARDRRSRG